MSKGPNILGKAKAPGRSVRPTFFRNRVSPVNIKPVKGDKELDMTGVHKGKLKQETRNP